MPKTVKSKTRPIISYIFIIVGAILIADTLIVKTFSHWNFGVVMPAVLGAPLLIYGAFYRRLCVFFKTRAGKVLKWFIIGCYIFITAVTAWGTIVIRTALIQAPPEGADAIIVPGAAVRDGKPMAALKNRLDKAAEYYMRNKGAVIVVTGGYDAGEGITEAKVMEAYLRNDKGLTDARIILEENSYSTGENFANAKALLDGLFNRPYEAVFVTNDFHIPRSLKKARLAGLNAYGLAAETPAAIAFNSYIRESVALLEQGY